MSEPKIGVVTVEIPPEIVDKIVDEGLREHHGHNCPVEEVCREASLARATEKAASSGPAKVSSASYRAGWEAIFGRRTVGCS